MRLVPANDAVEVSKASTQKAKAMRKALTRSSETGETKGRRDFVMMRWLTRISVEMEIDQLYATL